jgi:hypothetical protein
MGMRILVFEVMVVNDEIKRKKQSYDSNYIGKE